MWCTKCTLVLFCNKTLRNIQVRLSTGRSLLCYRCKKMTLNYAGGTDCQCYFYTHLLGISTYELPHRWPNERCFIELWYWVPLMPFFHHLCILMVFLIFPACAQQGSMLTHASLSRVPISTSTTGTVKCWFFSTRHSSSSWPLWGCSHMQTPKRA